MNLWWKNRVESLKADYGMVLDRMEETHKRQVASLETQITQLTDENARLLSAVLSPDRLAAMNYASMEAHRKSGTPNQGPRYDNEEHLGEVLDDVEAARVTRERLARVLRGEEVDNNGGEDRPPVFTDKEEVPTL